MIPGTYVVEDELSDAQRAAVNASNANITTGITLVPIQVDKVP